MDTLECPRQMSCLERRQSSPLTLRLWLWIILLWSCAIQPSNGGIYTKCLNSSDSITKRYFYIGDQTVDIRLEISDRISQQLITHILRILLEEVVGYVNVSLVKTLDYLNATLVLNRVAGCPEGLVPNCDEHNDRLKPPETMINLEVWMGPGFNMELWVNSGRLEHCGPLGPVGRFAWFIPQFWAHEGVQFHQIRDHWRALQESHITKLLDLSDDIENIKAMTIVPGTNEHYCNFSGCRNGIFYPPWCLGTNSTCATLLAKYPAVSNGVIRILIMHLQLKVRVAWIGPHLDDYVHNLTLRHKPVLFFSWKPSKITFTKNYTNIAFPRCEDVEIGLPFPSNCAFEINQLNKVAWAGLKESGEEAMHLVRGIRFTQMQYQELLQSYIQRPPGYSVSDIACEWTRKNTDAWKRWLPVNFSNKLPIYIGGIFPKSGINYVSKGIIPAVRMAVDAINRNDSILKDYELRLLEEDGACSADHVMKAFIKYVHSKEFPRIIGILGPACSDTVEPLAGVAKHYHSIIISYSAEGSIFYNNKNYPYFFRTIPSNKQFKYVYQSLFQQMGWHRVATLTEEGMKYPEYLSLTQDYLQAHGVSFVANRKFPRDRLSNNMTQYLEDIRKKNARILIGDFYDSAARAVMCEAYRQGMTAWQGYVWFLPRWFAVNWFDVDYYNALESSPSMRVPCTTAEMMRAINGYMSLGYPHFNDDDEIMQENITVREWRKNYYAEMEKEKDSEPDDYAGYSYDATWVYALGMDKLLKLNHSYISTLHTAKTARKYVEILNHTNFSGVSGDIHFVGPSRVSVIYLLQWLNNRTSRVGRYIPPPSEEQILELNNSAIVWLTHNKKPPSDGSEEASHCALELIKNLLDVDCEVAIVIVNIVGFGLFALLMLTCFLFIKQRYEKRVRLTEQRMKELGLMTASNMFALDQWEIPRDCVVINRKIGEGAFGTVFGGEVHFEDKGWVPVAVKTLKIGSTIEEKLDFLSEAEMMKRFEHQNVVRLLGVCTRGEPVYTIMEFMLYGDLKTYLLARRHMVPEKNREDSSEVSNKRLTSMALDVARGLSYLAEMKYVHRDLACRNCLVNTNSVVKIGDFGMTRPMFDSDYYRFNKKGMLPVRWMAPESLADGLFTPMSDVWSYGVLLFEILTFGSFPFQGLSNNQVLEHVKKGNMLNIPKGCNCQVEELLKKCWSRDPQLRPPASTIVEVLANNPQMVSPCLDIPLASVEIEGTNSLELQMFERTRKFSLSQTRNVVGSRKRSDTVDIMESIPLCHVGEGLPNGSLVENGINGGLKTEHRRGMKPVNSPSFHARYISVRKPL